MSQGWHFCLEWDFPLIGPWMKEIEFCICKTNQKEDQNGKK